MLFSSYQFIFAFLPLTAVVYFFLKRRNYSGAAALWLILASIAFYAWNNYYYALILGGSILINYYAAGRIENSAASTRKRWLTAGVTANLLILGFFKYSGFLTANWNALAGTSYPVPHLGLSLGISFITFMQIAFLIQVSRQEIARGGFLNYALFASFFPKLINGPIAYYREMFNPEAISESQGFNHDNAARGLFIFSIGMFKKLVIADSLVSIVAVGFDQSSSLSLYEAWFTSLAYTMQIYFDFSGYVDMAIGAAWFFNIKLPFNFNSPYRAISIRDFWKRWHMTLTRFLTAYLYIPLGGNRHGEFRTQVNVLITFLLSGLWHGAGWTFVFWGFLHGAATVLQRQWEKLGIRLPSIIGWFLTFNFVNIAWVFFRASDWEAALKVIRGMAGMTGIDRFHLTADLSYLQVYMVIIAVFLAVVITCWPRNSNYYGENFKPGKKTLALQVLLITICLIYLNLSIPKGFIYNDF